MSIREPAVAGMFYPSGTVALKQQIESLFVGEGGPGKIPLTSSDGPRQILGMVVPHAGYIYSGAVAANAYYRLAEDGIPDTVVIIGPNHRSFSPEAALTDDRIWRTPLGDMAVNIEIARTIAATFPLAVISPTAHYGEHSIEVQIPFLQYLIQALDKKIKIVPILIGASAHSNALDFSRKLGTAITESLVGRDAVIIASTDFTHYESSSTAEEKDTCAIAEILALDEKKLLSTVEMLDISMCGVIPTAVTLSACKLLGATSAQNLAYRDSGDVTGDYSEVVGYGALAMYR